MTDKEDDMLSVTSVDSIFSLDYEYIGPRQPNHRSECDADSVCSELSDVACRDGFDMWDEDPHSTNEFTWESNDMKLTYSIKNRKAQLNRFWNDSSFYHNEKGWPLQLPFSCSTANHDQSANSLSLLLSDYGVSERLHTIYRNRIIECGIPMAKEVVSDRCEHKNQQFDTTWLDSEDTISCKESKTISQPFIYHKTHVSVSLSQSARYQQQKSLPYPPASNNNSLLSKFVPYTKYIERSEIPTVHSLHTYLSLSFEPLCFEEKYGYMAVGGLEGEFEIYCCMDQQPNKIYGTKFKGKNNVLLMTNSIQIVRIPKGDDDHTYLLVVCMNDSGLLLYELSKHHSQHQVSLVYHVRSFGRVPINDARLSPDGQSLVCVGDDACLFHLTLRYSQTGQLTLTSPRKVHIPQRALDTNKELYSSQHISWSSSSKYFAHTSDTHNVVLVWRALPELELLYCINAGGHTFAVQFHPEYEGVLAFTNRYGYIHTVDLNEARSIYTPDQIVSIIPTGEYVENNEHLIARQEVTMVSFRGEKDKRLRILAKINGIQWSKDGKHLYVSTKKRVLAYRFIRSYSKVDSLETLAKEKIFSRIEGHLKRKRQEIGWTTNKKIYSDVLWQHLPETIQEKLTGRFLASH